MPIITLKSDTIQLKPNKFLSLSKLIKKSVTYP